MRHSRAQSVRPPPQQQQKQLPKWFASSIQELPVFLENIQRITAYTHRSLESQGIVYDILAHIDSLGHTVLAGISSDDHVRLNFIRKVIQWIIGLIKGYVDIITTRIFPDFFNSFLASRDRDISRQECIYPAT